MPGLLVLACGRDHNVIRLIPPINVTPDEVGEALGIIDRTLAGLPPGAGSRRDLGRARLPEPAASGRARVRRRRL